MIDFTGRELKYAEDYFKENGIEYTVKKTYALKPLDNTDSTFVLRQRTVDNIIELTVSDFRTLV